MSASDHIHPVLFHGTRNPNWKNNPSWIHLGDKQAAQNRITEGFEPEHGSYPGDNDTPGELYEVTLHPQATVYPKVIGTRDIDEDWKDDDGNWYTEPRTHDLGMLLDNEYVNLNHPAYSHPSGKPYDVYPYENIVEGGISFAVNPKAIKSSKLV